MWEGTAEEELAAAVRATLLYEERAGYIET